MYIVYKSTIDITIQEIIFKIDFNDIKDEQFTLLVNISCADPPTNTVPDVGRHFLWITLYLKVQHYQLPQNELQSWIYFLPLFGVPRDFYLSFD